jgi:hypothetical protein
MALAFLRGAYRILVSVNTDNYDTALGQIVSNPKALILYALWWSATAFALLSSKLHSNFAMLRTPALVSVYLACAYVFSLSWVLNGFGWHLTQAGVIGMLAGASYLRVKYQRKRVVPSLEERRDYEEERPALRNDSLYEAYQRQHDSRSD